VLDNYQFTVFPNAASNYGNTLLSVPSILNAKLPSPPDEFTRLKTPGGATVVGPNRLFEEFAAKHYAITVYQHRSIDYAAGSRRVTTRHDYSSEITGVEHVPGWLERVLWLAGDYQGSSFLLSRFRAFLPFRLAFRRTGPLAVQRFWPEGLLTEIEHTRQPTLFFVHLLVPHEPLLYRADGTVKPVQEWTPDTPVPPLPQELYELRFSRYCEQVTALSRQLREFLRRLSPDRLGTMTMIVHGDHGSRIYSEDASDQMNYRNQFSTLFAIRQPGSQTARHDMETATVMSLFARHVYGIPAPKDADLLYGIAPSGLPFSLSVNQLWRN